MKTYLIVTNDELEHPVKEIVGSKEAAEFLGMARQTFSIYVAHGFPKKHKFKAVVPAGKNTAKKFATLRQCAIPCDMIRFALVLTLIYCFCLATIRKRKLIRTVAKPRKP